MLERIALYATAALSAIALAYGAFINFSTFTSDPPEARFPGMDILFWGIFPVAGAASLFFASRMKHARPDVWEDTTFAYVPVVFRVLTIGVGLYAMALSIEQTTLGDVGVPSIVDGRYVLHNHGKIVKVLTAEEYRIEEAGDARVSSAFQMAFYMAALAMTIGASRMPKSAIRSEPPPVDPSAAAPRAAWKA